MMLNSMIFKVPSEALSSGLGPKEMPLSALNAPLTENSKHTGRFPAPALCSNRWFETAEPHQRARRGKWFSENHTPHPRAFAHVHSFAENTCRLPLLTS